MSGIHKGSSEIFLIISGIIFFVLTILISSGGAALLILEFIGPGIGVPWSLTFWEGLIVIPVICAVLVVGWLVSVPLWTLFVRPFVPRRDIRSSLTLIDTGFSISFFTWYCTMIADWLVPEEEQMDKTEGRDQLLSDEEKEIMAEMLMIRQQIELKYEPELSRANIFQKIFIGSMMHREIKKRVNERLIQRFESQQSTISNKRGNQKP